MTELERTELERWRRQVKLAMAIVLAIETASAVGATETIAALAATTNVRGLVRELETVQ